VDRRTILKHSLYAAGAAAGNLLGPIEPLLAATKPFPIPLSPLLATLPAPHVFRGDATTAYRDPAALYHQGWFYLYFTLVRTEVRTDVRAEAKTEAKTEANRIPYSYVAWSRSRDLQRWSAPILLTPRDKHLDYGSPGDVVQVGSRAKPAWLLCLQTYPRPNHERYGNRDSRIWTIGSTDLEHWSAPELLRVKGPDVDITAMGRMIDPYLLHDKDDPARWWCFYKQNGMSMSWSTDLKTWTYAGHISAGENPCVIVERNEYLLFHSPRNGIGIKRSRDLKTWRDESVTTLNQKNWPWAKGRITAGFVLDLRSEPKVGKALMFFHGSRFPEGDPRGGFDNFASIGIAWSYDLKSWSWPATAVPAV
jgi:hypothetical protein